MSDRFWRIVFLTAAIFNFVVGLSVAFDTSALAASVGLEMLRYDAFYSPLAGWFIILFGVLYLAVWRDLTNRAIVIIGLIGKLGVFALVLVAWARGLVPASIPGLGLIDVLYAGLFALCLLKRPGTRESMR